MKKRTYIDASVLIGAFRGVEPIAARCLAVLDDPARTLVVSDYVRLEVLPKPVFQKRVEEVAFMEVVLDSAENITSSPQLTRLAFHLAISYNLGALDALHAAAALVGQADELVTMEKPSKPLCQIQELRVVSLYLPQEETR